MNIIRTEVKSQQLLSVTSETNEFLCSLFDLLNLPNGWYFGKGHAPGIQQVAIAALIGDMMRQVGLEKREVFPCEDGGILVSGYYKEDTIEVFCAPNNIFRFSLERNDEDIEYLEGLTLSAVRDKIRRHSWRKDKSYGSSIPNTTVKKKSDTKASLSRTPQTMGSQLSVHLVLSG